MTPLTAQQFLFDSVLELPVGQSAPDLRASRWAKLVSSRS